jgi:hypothetical protein
MAPRGDLARHHLALWNRLHYAWSAQSNVRSQVPPVYGSENNMPLKGVHHSNAPRPRLLLALSLPRPRPTNRSGRKSLPTEIPEKGAPGASSTVGHARNAAFERCSSCCLTDRTTVGPVQLGVLQDRWASEQQACSLGFQRMRNLYSCACHPTDVVRRRKSQGEPVKRQKHTQARELHSVARMPYAEALSRVALRAPAISWRGPDGGEDGKDAAHVLPYASPYASRTSASPHTAKLSSQRSSKSYRLLLSLSIPRPRAPLGVGQKAYQPKYSKEGRRGARATSTTGHLRNLAKDAAVAASSNVLALPSSA